MGWLLIFSSRWSVMVIYLHFNSRKDDRFCCVYVGTYSGTSYP